MKQNILNNYVSTNDFPVITRGKRKYLTYEGLEDSYVYILKKGIIKRVLFQGMAGNLI